MRITGNANGETLELLRHVIRQVLLFCIVFHVFEMSQWEHVFLTQGVCHQARGRGVALEYASEGHKQNEQSNEEIGGVYPLVIKHGNGISHRNRDVNLKSTDKWSIFHCRVSVSSVV